LQTNIIAMFDLVRFAKEHMPPGSSIINTSSVVAYQARCRRAVVSSPRH